MSKQLTKYNLTMSLTTNNCVRKTEVRQELFHSFENLRKTSRPTDRHGVTKQWL